MPRRFDLTTEYGEADIILVHNTILVRYTDAEGDRYEGAKTEYRMPQLEFVNLEDYVFGDVNDDAISCEVNIDGTECTVKLTNLISSASVEWTFNEERSYGPLYSKIDVPPIVA